MSIDGRTRSAAAATGPKPRLHDEHDQRAVRLILDGLVRLRSRRLRGSSSGETVMFVRPIQFSKNRPRPSRGCRVPDARCAPSGGPKIRREPFFGEPYNFIQPTGPCQLPFLAPAMITARRDPSAIAWRRHSPAWLVELSVCPAWGPWNGPTWGRTPKAKFNTTRRGWACQPLSVVPARRPYLLPSPATPNPGARLTLRCLTYGRPTSRDVSEYSDLDRRCQPALPAGSRSLPRRWL